MQKHRHLGPYLPLPLTASSSLDASPIHPETSSRRALPMTDTSVLSLGKAAPFPNGELHVCICRTYVMSRVKPKSKWTDVRPAVPCLVRLSTPTPGCWPCPLLGEHSAACPEWSAQIWGSFAHFSLNLQHLLPLRYLRKKDFFFLF